MIPGQGYLKFLNLDFLFRDCEPHRKIANVKKLIRKVVPTLQRSFLQQLLLSPFASVPLVHPELQPFEIVPDKYSQSIILGSSILADELPRHVSHAIHLIALKSIVCLKYYKFYQIVNKLSDMSKLSIEYSQSDVQKSFLLMEQSETNFFRFLILANSHRFCRLPQFMKQNLLHFVLFVEQDFDYKNKKVNN
ncbi:hypothetical protein BpHYR1_053852 [Brachionus plicatilis]|uniref:Uncharacterized protein n=1 Tax=Brachionus plicatilis TaxID=10195 RepID=A0A3M7Q5Q4_BRAPC|nr:hypothetical protein BpHYR1_053852 [Brachionus plicatilis]